jgi:hypothetical protein
MRDESNLKADDAPLLHIPVDYVRRLRTAVIQKTVEKCTSRSTDKLGGTKPGDCSLFASAGQKVRGLGRWFTDGSKAENSSIGFGLAIWQTACLPDRQRGTMTWT